MTVSPLSGKALRSVALADRCRLVWWEGAVRSAKTVSSLVKWADIIADGPPGRLLVAGKTERTVDRNVLDPLREWFGRRHVHYRRGVGEVEILGRVIDVQGAHDRQAQDKVAGATYAGAYLDELTLLPEDFVRMVDTRLSVEGAQMLATMNPASPRHWAMTDWLQQASLWVDADGAKHVNDGGRDLARFSFRLGDNPHLPAGYVERLEREYSGLWRQRFIDGRWVQAEGAVWEQFDPESELVQTQRPRHLRRWWLACDHGTSNPLVMLLVAEGPDRRFWVLREFRWDSAKEQRQLSDAEYQTKLRRWVLDCCHELDLAPWGYEHCYVDPSAAGFRAELRAAGWPRVRPAANDVADGVRSVASMLGNDQLRVLARCSGLIDEAVGYAWDPKAQDRGKDEPLKSDDHGPDALRYWAHSTRHVWRNMKPRTLTAV